MGYYLGCVTNFSFLSMTDYSVMLKCHRAHHVEIRLYVQGVDVLIHVVLSNQFVVAPRLMAAACRR